MNEPKRKYPRSEAEAVAREIGALLKPACERIAVAGSLRRGALVVGDIELVYIPKTENRSDPDNFFGRIDVNLADEVILGLERAGVLARRKNVNGSEMYGPKNKLMVHASGIPVDLFATRADCWFNYLVCRTGPAESNTRIAASAKRMGWHWNPYGEGFTRDGKVYPMDTEERVFRFVGLSSPGKRTEIQL